MPYDIVAEILVGVYRNVSLRNNNNKDFDGQRHGVRWHHPWQFGGWDDITCALEGRRRPGKLSGLNQSSYRSQSPGNYWRSWSRDGAHTSHETSNGTDACLTDKGVFVVMSWPDGRPRFHHPARNARRQITLGASWPLRNASPKRYPSLSRAGPTLLRRSGERRRCAPLGKRE